MREINKKKNYCKIILEIFIIIFLLIKTPISLIYLKNLNKRFNRNIL